MDRLIRLMLFVALVATVPTFAFAQATATDADAKAPAAEADATNAVNPAPAPEDKKPSAETCAQCGKDKAAAPVKKASAKKGKRATNDQQKLDWAAKTLRCHADKAFVKEHDENHEVDVYGPWMEACEAHLSKKSGKKSNETTVSTSNTPDNASKAPSADDEGISKRIDVYYCAQSYHSNLSGGGEWRAESFACADGSTSELYFDMPSKLICGEYQQKEISEEVVQNDGMRKTMVKRQVLESLCKQVPAFGFTNLNANVSPAPSRTWVVVLAVVSGVVVITAIIATVVIIKNRNEHPNVINETRYVSEALTPSPRVRVGVAPLKGGGGLVFQMNI